MQSKEEILISKFKSGDSEAFGIIYDMYIQKIYRFVYYKVLHKETAEDIVSDVFYKALKNINSYDLGKGLFSAWLYRIARNTVIDYYRTKRGLLNIEDMFDLGKNDRLHENFDNKEILSKVSDYLKTISPKQREIITLRIWGELSYIEIAEIVGGTEGSTKTAFSRAIRDIRDKFGPSALLLLFLIGRL